MRRSALKYLHDSLHVESNRENFVFVDNNGYSQVICIYSNNNTFLLSLRRTICVTFLLANLITWVHLQNSPHWSMSVLLQTTFLSLTISGETCKDYVMACMFSILLIIIITKTVFFSSKTKIRRMMKCSCRNNINI